MQTINIWGKPVLVDIESELSNYRFRNERRQADKIIASSPFRDDNQPSFFVNLAGEYAGTWGDSGAYNEEYSKGNFVKLIALLNDMDYEDAERYLIDKYGVIGERKPNELTRIKRPSIKRIEPIRTIDNPVISAVSSYLIRRGISAQIQELYGIGYDKSRRGFTAFPIRTAAGEVANVFYRRSSISEKSFHYMRGGAPASRLLFGVDIADEVTILCEGIIDALSWETLGYSAIAVGGARISREQAEIIKRSQIRRLYLAGDNDEQGRKLNRQVARVLRGYVEMYEIDFKKEKDANDALLRRGIQFMHGIFDEASPIRAIQIRA